MARALMLFDLEEIAEQPQKVEQEEIRSKETEEEKKNAWLEQGLFDSIPTEPALLPPDPEFKPPVYEIAAQESLSNDQTLDKPLLTPGNGSTDAIEPVILKEKTAQAADESI